MSPTKSKLVGILVALALMLVSTIAMAQDSESMRIFVFSPDGLPAANQEVTVDGTAYTTDADGGITVELAPGEHTIVAAGTTQVVPIGDGSVEVLVNLQADGTAQFDVEGSTAVAETPVEKPQEEVKPGKITGVVKSMDKAQPVKDARVFVRGVEVEAMTDATGAFELELPPGKYDVSVVHPDFSTQDVPELVVKSEETTTAQVELSPASVMLEDFTVSAPRIEGGTAELLEERKESTNVMEIVGAEQMSKSGASDAADALSRVTGITVVGGRFIYIRGLGERYSSTLLNGSTLPSPDPERRVVPLDIFPTDVLESIAVQKNYSADMPGEFGGGVVELRTRRFPNEFEADVGISIGYRTGSTFNNVPHYQGGSLDWLGIDDGTRALPDIVADASQNSPLKPGDRFSGIGYSPEELEEFGQAMPNTWALEERLMLPNIGVNASIGHKFGLGGKWKAGYRVGLTYSNDNAFEESTESFYRVGTGGELELRNSYDFERAVNEVVLGGILTMGVEYGDNHKIVATTLLDRVSDNAVRIYTGFNRDAGDQIRVTRYRWIERQLFFQQLNGNHVIDPWNKLEIDWGYVFSQANRVEPDRKETRYDQRSDGRYRLSDRPEGNSRFYADLVDNNHDAHLDFTIPFSVWNELEAKAKTGVQTVFKNREAEGRRYKYFENSDVIQDNPSLADVFYLPPEEAFAEENIGVGRTFRFEENTRSTDNYRADQTLLAGYGLVDLPFTSAWMLSAGARLEYSSQNVETFELFNPDGGVIPADLTTVDVLPSLTLGWKFAESQQLRLAGARTVSRPDFRELSPLLFDDVAGGRAIQGNPDLERALITHADLRWEWFPSARELVSASVFAKLFDSPIESELQPGAQPLLTFQNAESAQNFGAEVETRTFFGWLADPLRDVFLAFNVAYIYSQVTLAPGGSQTNSERPLQGQSPYVINISTGYDNVESGTSLTVLYNTAGRRISAVGALGAPDTYVEPVHSLDVVFKQDLGAGLKLTAKGSNLLDAAIEETQGDKVSRTATVGRKFSLGVGMSF